MLLADLLAASTTTTIPAAPVLALMAFGIIIAIGGQLYHARSVLATGIAILFLATAAMVVGGFLAYQNEEEDPRERNTPSESGF